MSFYEIANYWVVMAAFGAVVALEVGAILNLILCGIRMLLKRTRRKKTKEDKHNEPDLYL